MRWEVFWEFREATRHPSLDIAEAYTVGKNPAPLVDALQGLDTGIQLNTWGILSG